jgi:hypothetical protein
MTLNSLLYRIDGQPLQYFPGNLKRTGLYNSQINSLNCKALPGQGRPTTKLREEYPVVNVVRGRMAGKNREDISSFLGIMDIFNIHYA